MLFHALCLKADSLLNGMRGRVPSGEDRRVRPKADKLVRKLSNKAKPVVVPAFQGADTSMVDPLDDVLAGVNILFLNYSQEWPKQEISELVVRYGGKVRAGPQM